MEIAREIIPSFGFKNQNRSAIVEPSTWKQPRIRFLFSFLPIRKYRLLLPLSFSHSVAENKVSVDDLGLVHI
ncbi:hypothetical protein PIB30_069890 [Stylosanthes scabra]|uniref:Uncharacterized protein n=1 Tax=Stylosanthes scabra TaxID=79078 RepID=A0ABU6SNE4_9FABA|nr:hypothetical protein [Stylosanthes scabra]